MAQTTVAEVLALLDAQRDERGIERFEKMGMGGPTLRSVGIGLTRLRGLAKQIGHDHQLAMELWASDVYEARIIALLIDDPRHLTREQAERQVEGVAIGMLAHVFSSCDATLAKTPFVVELAGDWIASNDPIRRECGYGLLYEASKLKGKKAPNEAFFLDHVERIGDTIGAEPERIRLAMATALMGIGKRSAALNQAALKVALDAGPIAFTSPSGNCEPFDVAKHLTAARLREKLGI
ncbi:MAG TPA: DNA alkylation repair protein [Fimbriimonadaceae bacterium]|nr:DNA alkylation repair protein [Fimbriimonadaceae bacterium]